VAPVRINDAVADALDAIGDDPDYAAARCLLNDAARALADGTTVEAAAALDRALAEIEAVCPI